MIDVASYETRRLDTVCCEPGCNQIPNCVAIAAYWLKQQIELYPFCEEHAKKAMADVRAAKADEEGLQ